MSINRVENDAMTRLSKTLAVRRWLNYGSAFGERCSFKFPTAVLRKKKWGTAPHTTEEIRRIMLQYDRNKNATSVRGKWGVRNQDR